MALAVCGLIRGTIHQRGRAPRHHENATRPYRHAHGCCPPPPPPARVVRLPLPPDVLAGGRPPARPLQSLTRRSTAWVTRGATPSEQRRWPGNTFFPCSPPVPLYTCVVICYNIDS